ncbi:MerR family transcriptional regulator [Salinibacterium sp. SWN139]|uniref:MerR family transcriptional regulator n=1 Tax=Salinibacterium sp. SWN139 TaxID=2792055 RepID=UPI0018CE2DF9|nr:MerR family transcriptional regulator [Salinibacterium sp. SWN139]MBH0053075.1 MerR family transcriptional regulator [Salinibacterium sp. SWN139]
MAHDTPPLAERSINDVARLTGTTSRTLRHYDDIGLLTPSRVGTNGYRYYGADALARLQRILLLRELGLGLPAIAEVLAGQLDDTAALRDHVRLLEGEKQRIDRLIASVSTTIHKLTEGEPLMAEEMFDGFDHAAHKDEVEQRWGADSYAASNTWWKAMSAADQTAFVAAQKQLAADWATAAERGDDPESDAAQVLAQRQFDALVGIPGTPSEGKAGPPQEYYLGLADLYVADPRFARNYGGQAGAEFVRAAMVAFAAARWS